MRRVDGEKTIGCISVAPVGTALGVECSNLGLEHDAVTTDGKILETFEIVGDINLIHRALSLVRKQNQGI
jgi:hypothetical protein